MKWKRLALVVAVFCLVVILARLILPQLHIILDVMIGLVGALVTWLFTDLNEIEDSM